MADRELEWRQCYIHRGRPALAECLSCGRPICAVCRRESGDPLLCGPCKERMAGEKAAAPASSDLEKIDRLLDVARDRSKLDVGEVTIHADGKVEAPVKEEGEPQPAEPEEEEQPPPAPEDEREKPAGPVPSGRARQPAAAPPARLPRAAGTAPAAPAPEPEEAEVPITRFDRRRVRVERKEVRKDRRRERGKAAQGFLERLSLPVPVKQLTYAIPWGFLAGALVFAAWLILAGAKRNWTQTSVLTAGVAVPWVIYRMTTAKRRMGRRVYEEPPKPWIVGTASVVVLGVLFVIFQFLAMKIIYRGPTLAVKDPFADFLNTYFGALNLVLVIVGFLLAFALPFFLKVGESWRSPAERYRARRSSSFSPYTGETDEDEDD